MNLMYFLLYLLGTIGLTHIVVDSFIFAPLREWLKNNAPAVDEPVVNFSGKWWAGKVGYMMTCYQCAGTWCGFLMGLLMLTSRQMGLFDNLVMIFCGGMVGSFAANWAAIYLTYLEAKAIDK